jgi:hypothetical protein
METTDPTAPERSASLTLDQIREGGQSLVLLCQTRMADLSEAIREGRFHDAMGHLQEIGAKLTALAQAENALGSLAESFIIRAEQIEEGMILRGMGTVATVRREEKPVPGDEPCIHLHFTFEGEMPDLEIHAEHEIVVMRSEG